MSELDCLLQDVQQNPRLLDGLRSRLGDTNDLRRWAHEQGYELDEGEVAVLRENGRELSDEEIDQAAAGAWAPTPSAGDTQ